jgi:hypothetical protein
MSRIYLPNTAIFGLMTEAGIWKKYIPTPIWNEISPFTTHPIILFSQSQTIGILKLIENIL